MADGAAYELVANLAQEAAQERMRASFDLHWVPVCDGRGLESDDGIVGEGSNGERVEQQIVHVRALVDGDHRLLLKDGENNLAMHEFLLSGNRDGNGSGSDKKEEKKEEEDATANGIT